MLLPQVEHCRIVLAMQVAIVLPQFEAASTVRSGSEQRPCRCNCFVIVRDNELETPHDSPVPVEQVTAVFKWLFSPQGHYPIQETRPPSSWFATSNI